MQSSQPTRQSQDSKRGILFMTLAILLFTLLDATAKGLVQRYNPEQVVQIRFLGQLVFVLLFITFVLRKSPLEVARTRHPWLHFWRAIFQVLTAALFFSSLPYIGLTEATALTDLNPVLITLGAALFLGERLGPRRLIGIAAALTGAMIVIRPGSDVFSWAALLPLGAAFSFAANSLLTRRIGPWEPVWTAMLWGGFFGTIAFSLAAPFRWQPIDPADIWLFIVVGLVGSAGQLCMIRALSLAEAGIVAPFSYLGIIFASFWGLAFFGEIPDGWTITGALVIALAGLYVWHRETRAGARS